MRRALATSPEEGSARMPVNATVPKLEPRGRHRPRVGIVRASEVMLGTGLFGWMLRLLDTVGRTESAIDIYKFLPRFLAFAANPLFQGVLIVSGFLLLWRFAKSSAQVSKSQIVHPETKLPFEHPIYPAFRHAKWTLAISAVAALSVWLIYRSSVHSYLLVDSLPLPEFHAPSPSPPVPVIGSPKKPQPVSPTVVDQSPARPLPHPQVESSNQTSNQPAAQAAQPNIRSDNQLSQMAKVNSPPPRIIPDDPVKAVEAVNRMRNGLLEVLEKKDTITFLMTWPDDDNSYLAFIGQLLSSACRTTPRQCWFTQPGSERDLDRPPIQGSGKRGITVHGGDAYALATALGAWFTTYSTSSLPPALNGYKDKGTKELIWIEIGPGSPWKPDAK